MCERGVAIIIHSVVDVIYVSVSTRRGGLKINKK